MSGWDKVPDMSQRQNKASGWDAVPDVGQAIPSTPEQIQQALGGDTESGLSLADLVAGEKAPKKPTLLERIAFSVPVQAVTDLPMRALQLGTMGPDRVMGIPTSLLEAIAPGKRKELREWTQRKINEREAAFQALPENQTFMADVNRGIIGAVTGNRMLPTGGGTLTQGALGGVSQPTIGGTSPGEQEEKALKQMALGTGAAGLMKGAEKVVGKGVAKAVNAYKGRLRPGASELEALGEKWGVDLTAGDFSKSLAKTEEAVGRIPLSGLDDVNAGRQEQAKQAANKFVKELESKVKGTGTPSEIAMASGRANQEANWQIGNQIYAEEARLAGTKEAPRNNVLAAIKEIRDANKMASSPDAKLTNPKGTGELDIIERRLTQTKAEAMRRKEFGMDRSYQGLSALRSEFLETARQFPSGTRENARYTTLAKAVAKDMDSFVANSNKPELKGVHEVATKWWKKSVKDYSPSSVEHKALANALRGDDLQPEKVMDTLATAAQGGKDKATYFYRGLDNNGRAAVRWGVAQDAYNKALDPVSGHFSPAAFKTHFKRNQEVTNVFFRGEDRWEMDGFIKLMEAVERVGSANSTVKTGWGAVTTGIGASQGAAIPVALASGQPLVALAAASPTLAARYAFKPLFTTRAGRRFLLASSRLDPGSPAMQRLIERELPRIYGSSAGNIAQSETDAPANEYLQTEQ